MFMPEEMNTLPVREDTFLRTRGSKVFSLGRGLHQTVLYGETVHALDEKTTSG